MARENYCEATIGEKRQAGYIGVEGYSVPKGANIAPEVARENYCEATIGE